MAFNIMAAIGYSWCALGVLWLIGILFTKRTVRSQSAGTRIFHVLLALLGFSMLWSKWFQRGWMAERFVPAVDPFHHNVQLAGLALVLCGCLFAAWARIALRDNWSGAAVVKAHHELIVKGPYALARHPIYTGLLLAVLGTALAVGEWRSVVGTVVIFLALAVKMGQEERLMMQTFPETYPLYRQRVRALIPGVI